MTTNPLNATSSLDISLPTLSSSSTLQAPIDQQLAKVSSSGNGKHVLLISIDGLREADLTDAKLQGNLTNILSLAAGGVAYSNAYTSVPSDSFPGELNYLTGAGPATTGVYYDDSYSRTLKAPGATSATPFGTEVAYAENIDKDPTLLNGGGGIDPNQLPLDAAGNPVYPHSFLQVNTIFNVAHDAGLSTAFSDKHPSYEIANGPSGNGVDDLYTPEINAAVAIENGKLVDKSTAQDPSKLTFTTTTNSVTLTEAYDDLKVRAIVNEIYGLNSLGTEVKGTPSIFGLNFQAVSVGEKLPIGGIALDGTPSAAFKDALSHTDASIGQIVSALKTAGLYDSTEIVLTAKHGQNPRLGAATLLKDDLYTNVLDKAGIKVAQATQDDITLLWLSDQSQTAAAAKALTDLKAANPNSGIDTVLFGSSLQQAGFGNPAQDATTPDLIVKLKPGFVLVGDPTKPKKQAEHGGFSEDDTHVALIVGGGAIAAELRGSVQSSRVSTKQIAVTALETLGLDASKLQGAVQEKTQALPGLVAQQEDGSGGNKTFAVSRGKTVTIANFGGVGQGAAPSQSGLANADTIKFVGDGLTARNMILTPIGQDLVITFAGIADTKVVLKNFKLEDLDNLSKSTGATADLRNIIFDGQTQGTDSFDVFNNDAPRNTLFNRSTVTYLDAISQVVYGFDGSDDVINASVGDHIVYAGNGNDILRGGIGKNTFYAGAGNDILNGGSGVTTMVSGSGKDTFELKATDGLDIIRGLDFAKGDRINLADGLTFGQLTFVQGTGANADDTLVRLNSGKLLAIVEGIAATQLSTALLFAPGDLIVSRSVYQGTASTITVGQPLPGGGAAIADGSYPTVFNNAKADASFGITSPIFLDQITTTGLKIGTVAIDPTLITTSFPSKSELALNLTPDGTGLTFIAYATGVNQLDVSNSNTPGIIEPGNPVTAAPTYRAIAQLNADGSLDITTSNIYPGNNGRAVILAPNGLYYTAGNAGNGDGSAAVADAAGVQIVIPGEDATALTPGTTKVGNFNITQYGYAADKTAKDNNFRGETIFNNTLFVSKGSGGNGINTVYQVGNAGTLPDLTNAATAPITILPGFSTVLAKGAANTITHPFGIWFANATTLYVADEGDGVKADAATSTSAGLQKWSLVNGTWVEDYVLQNGLDLGISYSVPGLDAAFNPATDGLRNLTGKVNGDGTVSLFAVTSTISASTDQGADPNKLVAIVDVLSNTTAAQAAGEKFSVIDQAKYGEVLRGVSFAPQAATV